MSALVDLRPLQESRSFLRLWCGSTLSAVGGQFSVFAVMYAVWELSRSTIMVGLLGLASALPLVAMALLGTSFVDTVDRVRLARATTGCQLVVALGSAVAAGVGSVAGLLVLAAANAALGALGIPARRALVPHLLPAERVGAALTLNSLSFQAAMLTGPLLAGLATAAWGVEVCFVIDAATFLAALIGLGGIRGPEISASVTRGWRAVREGLEFAVGRPVIRGALLSDLAATFLAMPMALFPAVNQEKFGGSPVTLGLFTTAVAVGGVTGTLLSGTITGRPRPGLVMTQAALLWGGSLTVAGLAGSLPVVLVMLAVAGAADTWSVVSRGTLVQTYTPDHLRGRAAALEHVVGAAGPHVGNFRAGLVASVTGGGPAMALGGLSCIAATALIYRLIPGLRAHRVPMARDAMT